MVNIAQSGTIRGRGNRGIFGRRVGRRVGRLGGDQPNSDDSEEERLEERYVDEFHGQGLGLDRKLES